MHASSLLTLAAALLAISPSLASSEAHAPRALNHRSRARSVQQRNSAIPSGWKLSAACLKDADEPNRLLSTATVFLNNMSPTVCTVKCDSEGYKYAALQDGHECWCGNELNNGSTAGVRTDVAQCNMPCSGDSDTMCGGYWTLTLYEKTSNSTKPHSSSSVHRSSTSAKVDTYSTSAAPTTTSKAAATTSKPASTKPASSSVKPSSSSTKAATSSSPSSTSSYKLIENFSGSKFFSGFNFFDSADPTGGSVNYLSKDKATSSNLAYVDSNGVAVMRVDNTTYLNSGASRNSVRIESSQAWAEGLFIYDIAQMPYGCSVWPAMWMVGPSWPSGGEIDIIENVNNASVNQLTLHTATSSSCTTTAVKSTDISTNAMGSTCASSQSADAGCGFQDNTPSAFGQGFNAAGGAVFAVWIDTASNGAVSIYKFARGKVPSDITSGSPTPGADSWGKPQAYWPGSASCQMKNAIQKQQIVFDITLCGGWCASDYPNSGCPGTCTQRLEDPQNFDTAVWKVNSVKVYQD